MFKRVGKPLFFIIALIIAGMVVLTFTGIHYYSGGKQLIDIKGASDIRFGIDIKGGVDVTFRPEKGYNANADQMKAATAKINVRLDNLKISDRDVFTDVKNQTIIVRFPWKSGEKNFDPEAAIKELGAMAQLTFKDPSGNVILTGSDVTNAAAAPTQTGSGYEVDLTFSADGTKKFADATSKLVGKTISIYMDTTQIEAPVVQEAIDSGKCTISNSYKPMTSDEAKSLADKINAGALPFKLVTDNYNTISPTLGAKALDIMVMAGLVAGILICLFLLIYYRLPGFVAIIALCGHMAGTILAISIPQFTLTLPGIAGLILSIGMGVDCNIITAERIKEELRAGKTIDGAIDAGFDRSFSAIFDGNITVIIAGAILMWLGSGSVQSFGYTLIMGVVFNFVMGIFFSRLMLKAISKFSFLRSNKLYHGGAEAK